MLKINADQTGLHCDGLSRRNFLEIGSLAMGGLALPQLLQAEAKAGAAAQRQKSVIMIFLGGGPSHQDMWDIKEDAPLEYRGEFNAIPTSVPGVRIGEHFPKLAKMWDKCAAIRSTIGQANDHNAFHCMTGHQRRGPQPSGGWPSIGSVVAKMEGEGLNGTPPNISLSNRDSGPGFLGTPYKPFAPSGKGKQDLTLNGVTTDRLGDRRQLLASFDQFRRDVDNRKQMVGLDKFNEQAFGVITSNHLLNALDLKQEDPRRLAKYEVPKGYRDVKSFCTARRIVEAGARFVTLSWGSWDTHRSNFITLRKQLPALDIGLSALISDLAETGRLEDTSIVVWGEFGRTPRVNGNAGRDHWPRVMGTFLAGGGMNTGQIIGQTDRTGGEASERPIHIQEVLATLYHNVGIDVAKAQLSDLNGRPQYLTDAGRGPIKELI